MRNTVKDMTLSEYFEKWWSTATTRMQKDGVVVDITLFDFLNKVVTPRQYASLQKSHDAGWLNSRQSADNDLAYVITWKSYSARSTNVYNLDTACFCTRLESLARCKPAKGEELREVHRAKIGTSLTDKPKTEEHAQNISESLTGRTLSEEHKSNLRKPKAAWTEERKAARRAQIALKKESN